MAALGDKPAAKITPAEIETLLRTVAATGQSARTVNRTREIVCAAFNYGMKSTTYSLPTNPALGTDRRRAPEPGVLLFYSPEETEAVARSLDAGFHRPAVSARGEARALRGLTRQRGGPGVRFHEAVRVGDDGADPQRKPAELLHEGRLVETLVLDGRVHADIAEWQPRLCSQIRQQSRKLVPRKRRQLDRECGHLAYRALGTRLVLENMDDRKATGRIADEMETFFQALPDAGFCFDIAHAHSVDPSLDVASELVGRFRSRLRHVHLSSLSGGHHVPVSAHDEPLFMEVLDRCRGVPWILEAPPPERWGERLKATALPAAGAAAGTDSG
jgi:hypothetical protein